MCWFSGDNLLTNCKNAFKLKNKKKAKKKRNK